MKGSNMFHEMLNSAQLEVKIIKSDLTDVGQPHTTCCNPSYLFSRNVHRFA